MTMQLMQFDFEMATVRTVCDDGQPWFVGADIVHALGYAEMNPNLFNHVPDEWKGVKRIQGNRGEREAICLSEQGLYFFVVRSDKPKALPFQKWLAGVVLPAIRKTGYYRQGKPADPMGLYAKKVQIMEKLTRTSHPTIRQELRDWLGWTCQQLGHAVPDANNLHPAPRKGIAP